ncbi:MAG TPA: FtsX-like permease family protein, partial [Bryobacteraceae bacterium]|nr:FtsX-like permease family protein [Bryobacteraceae bacterium]
RARIVRQFLTESMALAAAGAAGGWLFAVWSTRVLVDVLSTTDNPVQLDLHPDWRILFFSLTVTVAAGILFGVGPALRATRHGVAPALKERAFQVRGGEERIGLGRALLGIQVALSVVLLAAAGLFAGTLVRLMRVDMGFHPEGLTVISIADSHPPMEAEQAKRLFGRLMQRARTIPGVEIATLIWPTPLTNSGWNDFFTIPGRPDLSEDQRLADISSVGTRFTETMQVPLRAGRDFNDGDTAQSEKVALISENAARRWFPNGRAVGSEIGLASSKSMVRVVGIVGNYRYFNLRQEVPLTVYLPYTQNETHGYVAIRTNQPVNATYAAFRAILREEAHTLPVGTIRTMKQQVDESLSTERLTAYLSVFIGALALLLTSVGLYGILAYSVARRTGEIGIRMALGAQRRSVVWLVVRKALAHTLVGVGAGVVVVLASSRVAKSLLYNVKPNDPATIGAAVCALLVVCAVAALLPARRASRMDPMQALREE